MDRLDMSLDELIKDKPRRPKKAAGGGNKKEGKPNVAKSATGAARKNGRDGNGNGNGGARKLVQPTAASHQVIVQPHAAAGNGNGNGGGRDRKPLQRPTGQSSILNRLAKPGVSSGTSITFENLNYDINKGDIAELCGTVGEIKNAEITFDRSGRSTGVATVIFSRRSDAVSAIQKFNGLALDGAVMRVKLSAANGQETPFNPAGESSAGKRRGSAEGKAAMFGTAISGGRSEEPRVRVNLGGGGSSASAPGVCYAFQRGECNRGDDCKFTHEAGDVPAGRHAGNNGASARRDRDRGGNSNSNGGGGGNKAGNKAGGNNNGGNKAGGNNGGRSRDRAAPVSSTSLDSDMEAYFSKRE